MSTRRLFGKYDLFIFAAVIIIAVIIYILTRGETGAVCEIKVDGKVTQIINLSDPDREFELTENSHIKFKIKNHAIAFTESNCPDKICVNTGYINYAGQSAVCLPNRVSIHITGGDGVDIAAK